jgi:hypothetical protein
MQEGDMSILVDQWKQIACQASEISASGAKRRSDPRLPAIWATAEDCLFYESSFSVDMRSLSALRLLVVSQCFLRARHEIYMAALATYLSGTFPPRMAYLEFICRLIQTVRVFAVAWLHCDSVISPSSSIRRLHSILQVCEGSTPRLLDGL